MWGKGQWEPDRGEPKIVRRILGNDDTRVCQGMHYNKRNILLMHQFI